MADTCPHCGAELPLVRDAFCPACRNDLEDAPAPVPPSDPPDRAYDAAEPAIQWSDPTPRRPLGITILAVLHLAGGIFLGALQLPLLAKLDELEGPLRALGLPPILLVVGAGFLALLGIASGVGMWLGRKWGWWLGAFYQVYGVARNASALLTFAGLADELAGSARGPGYYYAKHTGRVVVHLLLLLYFFKGNVLQYFGLEGMSKWKAISALVGVCLAVGGIASVLAWFVP